MQHSWFLVAFGLGAVVVGAAAQTPTPSSARNTAPVASANRTITAVDRIKVGSITLAERPTGCTVILVDGDGIRWSVIDVSLRRDVAAWLLYVEEAPPE